MNDLMSALTRSTGIVATVLAVAAVVWGFTFSARATGERRRPNWWLDLHNWLGGAALVFTALHVATAYLDRNLALRVVDLVVPGAASTDRLPLAWGVIGFWTYAVAVFTTWPRRRFRRPVWRVLHLGSVAGTGLAIAHALQLGSDTGGTVARVVVLFAALAGSYTMFLRIFSALPRPRR